MSARPDGAASERDEPNRVPDLMSALKDSINAADRQAAKKAVTVRPGGWVDGIGWVTLYGDLTNGDRYRRSATLPACDQVGFESLDAPSMFAPVIVTRWGDGTEPTAPEAVEVPRAEWDGLVAAVRAEGEAAPGHDHLAAAEVVVEWASDLVAAVGGES